VTNNFLKALPAGEEKMVNKTNPIVTYRQLDQAFNKNHEAVMESAQHEALNATNDPPEAAMMLASLGNALKTLEAADSAAAAGVLLSTEHKAASLLQSYIAEQCAEDCKLDALAFSEDQSFDRSTISRITFS
jgi:hypothetical protein